MKRALGLVNAIPRLAEIEKSCEERGAAFSSRYKFMIKQLADLDAEKDAAKERMNLELADCFRELGLLPPDYSPHQHHFHYDSGAVVMCDHSGSDGAITHIDLSSLFRGRPT